MSGNSLDKSQRYEALRSRAIDERQAPSALSAVCAVVLVRQGMSAWMAVWETEQAAPPAGGDESSHATDALPAPMHTELLAVLTGLVFNIRRSKESA